MQHLLIIGSWRLESYLKKDQDGHIAHPMGDHPCGQILYSSDGHMSVQIMTPDRAPFSSDKLHEKTDAELIQAARGYFAYSGLYEVEWQDTPYSHVLHGRVTHHMVNSLFPNWIGRSLVRSLTLEGDRLELSTCQPDLYRGRMMTTHLVWRKNRFDPVLHRSRAQQFERIEA